jgi:thymidine phosphorylase
MIETGEQIDWGLPMVLDKHCIGGIPGNRTTMVVVPIVAREILESGLAWNKFLKIAKRQGPIKELEVAPFSHRIKSPKSGTVRSIHNQKMAQAARLAGAPADSKAGAYLHAKAGEKVRKGETLFEVFAETVAELQFAVRYVAENRDIVIVR